jgi:hypothetical protein
MSRANNNNNNKRKLPEDEVLRITKELKSIKQKNVEEMRRLSQTALDALIQMEEIENSMEEEARMVYPNYAREIHTCKLTFARSYKERVEDCGDGDEPTIETIRFHVQLMNEDSKASTSSVAAAEEEEEEEKATADTSAASAADTTTTTTTTP